MNIYELEKQATPGRQYRDENGRVATTDGVPIADANVNDRDIDEREANTLRIIHQANNFMRALEELKHVTRLARLNGCLFLFEHDIDKLIAELEDVGS